MSCGNIPPKLGGTPGELAASGNIWFSSSRALVLDTALTSSHTASAQDGDGSIPDCFQMHLKPDGLHLHRPAPNGGNLSSNLFSPLWSENCFDNCLIFQNLTETSGVP